MEIRERLLPKNFQQKPFFKILFLLIVLFGVYFLFFKKTKLPPKTSPYKTLNAITERFTGAQKEVEGKNVIVYSLKGNLVRMWFEKDLVVYEYDLGKEILLGQKELISLPTNILPFEYFGKKVTKSQELDLGKGELNLLSELKIWCRATKKETSPCQVIKWAIYSLPEVKEPGPFDEISRKVLAWLETQKNEKGIYNLGQLCKIDGRCEMAGEDNRCGLPAIWARFKYFERTKQEGELEIIRKDLKTYTDPSKVFVIQNNFWNCKLMYEMWQSEIFSEGERGKIEEICWNSIYPLGEEGSPSARVNLEQVLERKRFYVTAPTVLSDKGGEMTEYSAFASDFSARFLWKKDTGDLKRAEAFFDKAVSFYDSERENKYLGGRCVLGIASLDLYEVTSDSRYLDFAKSFWEKEGMEKICLAEKDTIFPNRCQDSLFEEGAYSLFAQDLYKVTKDEKYKDFKTKIRDQLINRAWDSKGYKGEFLDDGSFYSRGRGIDKIKANIYKAVRENGLVVGVLLGED